MSGSELKAERISLWRREHVTSGPLEVLRRHTTLLHTPRNMFLVPKSHAGFGELPDDIVIAILEEL